MRIVVAGATGDIGLRIVKALRKKNAEVVALRRGEAKADTIAELEATGATITPVDYSDSAALADSLSGAGCVVSVLAGLHGAIVDTQTTLLNAAVEAGVPKFIPSDFCTDFDDVPEGANRNLDLRREFSRLLAEAPIRTTSIRNGAFAEVLHYNTPLLNFRDKVVGFFGDADHLIDFTTKDDVAALTACAALDQTSPAILRIASFRASPADLVAFSARATGAPFRLVRMGSLDDLADKNRADRAADPDGESQLYPAWQQQQYLYGMLSVTQRDLANDRYLDLAWTPIDRAVPLQSLMGK